jgi:GxxExxY protein
MKTDEKPIHAELSYKIYGILFAVQNELGRFRNEQQYSDAIEKYLKLYGMSYEREKVLPQSFEGELEGRNRVDFLIENKVPLEVKVKNVVERADYYQVKRYLVSLNKKLGILVNFRDKFLRPKRILNSSARE